MSRPVVARRWTAIHVAGSDGGTRTIIPNGTGGIESGLEVVRRPNHHLDLSRLGFEANGITNWQFGK
jgi:hypothetical protein